MTVVLRWRARLRPSQLASTVCEHGGKRGAEQNEPFHGRPIALAREGRLHAESKKDFKGWGKPSSLSDKRVKAIRKARHEKNRTLKDIAEEYGISVSYAHRLTNDEKRKQYNEAHKARQREKYAEAN